MRSRRLRHSHAVHRGGGGSPKLKAGQPDRHRIWRPGFVEPEVPVDPTLAATLERERHGERIVVPDQVAQLHPLVGSALPTLQRRAFETDIWLRFRRIDIRVSRDTLDRAARIMHALLTALEARGVDVEVTAPKLAEGPHDPSWRYHNRLEQRPSRTIAHVMGEAIAFGLREDYEEKLVTPPRERRPPDPTVEALLSRIRPVYPRTKPRTRMVGLERRPLRRVPTGQLLLHMDVPPGLGLRQSWGDATSQRVENVLNSFVAGLHVAADSIRRQREAGERAERARQEEGRRRREQEARQRRHDALVKDLHARMSDWRSVHDIRELAAAVEAQVANAAGSAASATTEWVAWARRWADAVENHVVTTVAQAWAPERHAEPWTR